MPRGKVPDLIAPDLRVLFCGINPGLYSARVRRHFANPGNRFWKALHGAGFTEERLAPSEQATLLARGCGITNLVARETASAVVLGGDELRAGRRALERKVRRYRPAWIAILGVTAYRTAFDDPRARVGLQERRLAGARVWVLPNPSGLNAHYQIADLQRSFRELRETAGIVDRGSATREARARASSRVRSKR
jgi:TDG/mug DNA glycosylase family protein